YRSGIDDVERLFIPTPDGHQIPLSQVAEVKYELGPAQISREDGKRRIVIGFNIHNRDVSHVVNDIEQRLSEKVQLPEGYFYTYGGTFENLQAASKRLMIAVPFALALIFLLLFFAFRSVKEALLIYTAIPMSAIGGVLALLIRDMPFSISAGVGFIALFGVAVLNGIVLIGTFNQLIKEKLEQTDDDNYKLSAEELKEIIMEGCKIRLRPVLMTATVASWGFLPMALSHSAGAEVQKPLATVVIGGLITATFLTLFVLPLLFYMFSGKRRSLASAFTVVAVIGLLQFLPSEIKAQSSGVSQLPVLTIQQALDMALKNNLQLQSQQLNVQSAEKMKRSVFDLPKTEFNLQYGQYNSLRNDLGLSLSQNIPFPTYFTAKSKLYEAELQSNRLKQEIYKSEIAAQIKALYYGYQYLMEQQRILRSLDSVYGNFVDAAKLRYTTGE